MSRFPSEKHISSWARSGWTGKGNIWIKTTLVEAAWSAVRNRNTYYAALYHRLSQRRGKKRAIVAVAHSLLVTIYFMLRDGTMFQDSDPTTSTGATANALSDGVSVGSRASAIR